jgi:hypothetical protein
MTPVPIHPTRVFSGDITVVSSVTIQGSLLRESLPTVLGSIENLTEQDCLLDALGTGEQSNEVLRCNAGKCDSGAPSRRARTALGLSASEFGQRLCGLGLGLRRRLFRGLQSTLLSCEGANLFFGNDFGHHGFIDDDCVDDSFGTPIGVFRFWPRRLRPRPLGRFRLAALRRSTKKVFEVT